MSALPSAAARVAFAAVMVSSAVSMAFAAAMALYAPSCSERRPDVELSAAVASMRAWVATALCTVKPVPTMRPTAAIAPAAMIRLRPVRRRRMPRRVRSAAEMEAFWACVLEGSFRIGLGFARMGIVGGLRLRARAQVPYSAR